MTDPMPKKAIPDTPSLLVERLSRSMAYGPKLLDDVPGHVVKICAKNEDGEPNWKRFVTRTGNEVHHEDFRSFVTTKPLAGLGCSVEALERACSDDSDAMAALDEALRRPAHRPARKAQPDPEPDDADPKSLDNVKGYADGNSQRQALRRLRKDRPDLLERVKTREMSANAAMILAGFRPATLTLRLTEPERVAAAILRKAETDPIVAQAVELIANRRPCSRCGN